MRYYVKTRNSGILPKRKKVYLKFLGGAILACGLFMLSYFFFPLLSYQLFLAQAFEQGSIEVPIPKYLVMNKLNPISDLIGQGIASLSQDYTDARNWYPQVKSSIAQETSIDHYSISIPSLKIDNAVVSTKDYDLSRHLVQYFGTALPGENGTAVVFGHSTLPQWFDSKNYKTIFATLHNIKTGDEIVVNVNDVTYKYKIFSINITGPDDINMFSQSYDHSYITLITCTPPGTIWKRLIVRASLESI